MSSELYHLYPSDWTNRQWENIKEYIPAAKPGGRPRTLDMRLVLNAIFYVLIGGVQWRMLPREYPNWKSVYHYFRLWRKDGTWQRIHDALRAKVRRQAGKHKHPNTSIQRPLVWTRKASNAPISKVKEALMVAKKSKVVSVIYWLTRWD